VPIKTSFLNAEENKSVWLTIKFYKHCSIAFGVCHCQTGIIRWHHDFRHKDTWNIGLNFDTKH
jgi:hypothetical protein